MKLRWSGFLLLTCCLAAVGCGGLAADGRAPLPLCDDGQLRLTEEFCGDGRRLVEECRNETWHPTDACREPDGCEEGATIDTGEQCGEYFFNRRLQRCSGGLLQVAECSCGAEDPTPIEGGGTIYKQSDVDAFAGKTFPPYVFFGAHGTDERYEPFEWNEKTIVKGLEHLRCAVDLWVEGAPLLPAFPQLRGVGTLSLSTFDASAFPNLEEADAIGLNLGSTHINGLSSLREVRDRLSIYGELTSLDGLEALRRVGTLHINYASRLTSIRALSGLEALEGYLFIQAPALTDLTGLHNIRTIAGDMTLRIADAKDLQVFEKLESVGGDVFVGVGDPDLICTVGLFFSQKSIGGTLTVASSEPFDPAACD